MKYLQKICESCGTYLTINSDDEIEYHVLDTPSSADEVTDIEALAGTVEVSVDYNDIATEIIASNRHANELITQDDQEAGVVVENAAAARLHGLDNRIKLEHVCDDITGRLPALLRLRSSPKIRYKFDTATYNMDSIIGDDIKIVSDIVPGGEKQVKITRINKNSHKTSIESDDLGDL